MLCSTKESEGGGIANKPFSSHVWDLLSVRVVAWTDLRFAARVVGLVLAYFFGVIGVRLCAAVLGRPFPYLDIFKDPILDTLQRSVSFETVLLGFLMLLSIPLNLIYQYLGPSRGVDLAFYARPREIRRIFSAKQSRATMFLGLLLLIGYWVLTSAWIRSMKHAGEGPLPPERIFCTILLIWGFFWVGDCFNRPQRTTFGAALVYLLGCLFVTWDGLGVLTFG